MFKSDSSLIVIAALLLINAAAVADVRITGLSGDLLANAFAHLSLDDEACDSPAWRVKRLLRQGEKEILAAAQAYGYYDTQVVPSLRQEPDCWQAEYVVTPGEPVIVRSRSILLTGTAADDPEFARIIAQSPLQEQQALRHSDYEALKRSLLDTASRRGYADAVLVRHRVSVNRDEQAADVTLELDTGQRYAFGTTRFEQQVLEPGLIERYLTYRRGDPYDSRRLADLYAVLAGSGYFERIQVEPLPDLRADGEIPVAVMLTPGKRKVYTSGVGFSTNTGPRLRAGYTNRRIDEKGHQWGTSLLMSNVVSEVSGNYRRPRGDPRVEWLSFDMGFKHESTDTSNSDAYQLGVRQIKQRADDWRENRFVDFLIEDFEIGEQSSKSTLIIPGISWIRTRSDNRLRPHRGSQLLLEVRGSADALGSDTNFLRFDARTKLIRSLLTSSRLILRGELGASVAGEFSELPPSLRFFAGGDASVRGYDYETLGPKDAAGDVIGGNGKLIVSLEYEQDVMPKWSVAAFVDSGNAFDDFDLEAQTGAGLGARWWSPVGPVRLDLAKPFNGADRSVRIHVTFGPDL